MLDLAVVGGGPAGLAVALGTLKARPGAQVKVFERSPGLQKRGAGIALYYNGVAALSALDASLLPMFQARALPKVEMEIQDLKGSVLSRDTYTFGPGQPDHQEARVIAPWYELQASLYERLPNSTVEFGKQLKDLSWAEDSATANFEDGSSCQARVIVGCDGILSCTRECWLQDGQPRFDQKVNYRGRINRQVLKQLPGWPQGVDSLLFALGNGQMGSIYSLTEELAVWTALVDYNTLQERGGSYKPYHTPRTTPPPPSSTRDSSSANGEHGTAASSASASAEPESAPAAAQGAAVAAARRGSQMDAELAGRSLLSDVLKMMDLYPRVFKQAVLATDPDTISAHGQYSRPIDQVYEMARREGPVTLAGDAVQYVFGQGANLAFEDAAVLCYHLQRLGFTPEALRAYEADRAPRLRGILERSVAHVKALATDSKITMKKVNESDYGKYAYNFQHPCVAAAAAAAAGTAGKQ